MQADFGKRYALASAADAKRYVAIILLATDNCILFLYGLAS